MVEDGMVTLVRLGQSAKHQSSKNVEDESSMFVNFKHPLKH